MTGGEVKDALAREIPDCPRCREALRDALVLYGSRDGRFVAHRPSVARLFWSLLGDARKDHRIERLPASRLGLPAFAIDVPAHAKAVAVPVRVGQDVQYERADVGVLPKRDFGMSILCASKQNGGSNSLAALSCSKVPRNSGK